MRPWLPEITTNAGKETATISARLAIKDEDKLLPIIKEIMVNPSFKKIAQKYAPVTEVQINDEIGKGL